MENFILGIQSVTTGMGQSIKGVGQYSIFWGFAFGFLVSTLMHGFLMTENPRDVPTMLLRSSANSFEKIHKKGENGSYEMSYNTFVKTANNVKFIFGLSFLLFVLIILVAMFRV